MPDFTQNIYARHLVYRWIRYRSWHFQVVFSDTRMKRSNWINHLGCRQKWQCGVSFTKIYDLWLRLDISFLLVKKQWTFLKQFHDSAKKKYIFIVIFSIRNQVVRPDWLVLMLSSLVQVWCWLLVLVWLTLPHFDNYFHYHSVEFGRHKPLVHHSELPYP